jgi:hypothetical protein
MVYQSRPTVGATRARQGRFGRHMIWVLIFGTLLAAIGMFAAWTWKAPDMQATERSTPRARAAAAQFTAPEPAPTIPQPAQKATPPETNHIRP